MPHIPEDLKLRWRKTVVHLMCVSTEVKLRQEPIKNYQVLVMPGMISTLIARANKEMEGKPHRGSAIWAGLP